MVQDFHIYFFTHPRERGYPQKEMSIASRWVRFRAKALTGQSTIWNKLYCVTRYGFNCMFIS